MQPDEAGMARLGLSHLKGDGLLVSECGFERHARERREYRDRVLHGSGHAILITA